MDEPAPAIEVGTLRETMMRFTAALEAHREELDSLNVFPVPDGDTGTNLLLTQRAVSAALEGFPREAGPAEFAETVTRASLMGARGNSGVILAQVLRGLVERLLLAPAASEGLDPATSGRAVDGSADATAGAAGALADALRHAAEEARTAVARPVEGTVLTVLADAASAASAGAGEGRAVAAVAATARDAALVSLGRTTRLLPELTAAGVVDAGGLGAVLLLDALASVLGNGPMIVEAGPRGPVGSAAPSDQELVFKYEVVAMLRGDDHGVAHLRDRLGELGDSVVIVGGDGRYKVHVHTDDPDEALHAIGEVGTPEDVTVVDLEERVAEACVAGQARAVRVGERQSTALVAIVDGDGLAALFRSLGAVVVAGGPDRAPEVEDLVEAAEAAPAESVVVVPTDEISAAVAERAAGDAGKDVWVVFAGGVMEGLAAAAEFNPTVDAAAATERMSEAAAAVTSASLWRETADGWFGESGGARIAVGVGAAAAEAAAALVTAIRTDGHELVTILVGANATAEDTDLMSDAVRRAVPELQLEVHASGHSGAEFLFGLQ